MTVDLTPTLRPDSAALIQDFIASQMESTGARRALLGLSGGIDSALVAKLAVAAIGGRRVHTLLLPLELRGPDYRDAAAWAKKLGTKSTSIALRPFVEPLLRELPGDRVSSGNIAARLRMILLYHHAKREHGLVLGTGNKSEALVGYMTKHGDAGVDFSPIGDLYKTQVRLMAKELGLPRPILKKAPTAGLWPGQTDEGDLGIDYDSLDRILVGIEGRLPDAEIAKRGKVPLAQVRRIRARVVANRHKRVLPMIPKLGLRTIGIDWLD